MVTTGTSTHNGGPVNVFVDSGSGYIQVNTPGISYVTGVTVADQCFDTIVGVQVSNDGNDAWVGSIELSMDGKTTYYPLVCSDCTGKSNAMPIVVDGNADSWDQAMTWCLRGAMCTLTVSCSK